MLVCLAFLAGMSTAVPPGPARAESPPECVHYTAGFDSSDAAAAITGRGTFKGEAVGETFLALDTLITRITVWRPAIDIDALGTRLFVTRVDTNKTPPRPVTQAIVQDGPLVFVRESDPPGQIIRMDFNFDPPLVLPFRGMYAMFFQRDHCDWGSTYILGSESDPYPPGRYWQTGHATVSCYLASTIGSEDNMDLYFQIEYCRDAATPVSRRTWGELKLLYR